jgi:hypothetical protein
LYAEHNPEKRIQVFREPILVTMWEGLKKEKVI